MPFTITWLKLHRWTSNPVKLASSLLGPWTRVHRPRGLVILPPPPRALSEAMEDHLYDGELGSHAMVWRGIASDGYLCSERVTLHGVVGGGRYVLPGACTPENGWTLNGVQFQVENILGRHLLCLERGADGSWVLECESDGQVMLSAGRVIAVKSRLWEVADRKMNLILAADSDHRVWVELGIQELPFTG